MFNQIKYLVNYLIIKYQNNKFKVQLAKTEQEIKAIKRFWEIVYLEELNYQPNDGNGLTLNLDIHATAKSFYIGTTEQILGTITIVSWPTELLPDNFYHKYDLAKVDLHGIKRVAEIRYFMLVPELRNSLASVALLSQIYNYFDQLGYPELFFGYSSLGLIHAYIKLGSFFYTNKLVYDDFGAICLPFASTPFDLQYLKQNNSLFYYFSKQQFKKIVKLSQPNNLITLGSFSVSKHFHIIPPLQFTAIDDILTAYPWSELVILILQNTTASDRLIINVEQNYNLIPEGERDFVMYIIIEGEFMVCKQHHQVISLKKGDIFGELAFFANSGKRTASIKAVTTGKLLMVKYKFFKRLTDSKPRLGARIYYLFCQVLANKIRIMNDFYFQ